MGYVFAAPDCRAEHRLLDVVVYAVKRNEKLETYRLEVDSFSESEHEKALFDLCFRA